MNFWSRVSSLTYGYSAETAQSSSPDDPSSPQKQAQPSAPKEPELSRQEIAAILAQINPIKPIHPRFSTPEGKWRLLKELDFLPFLLGPSTGTKTRRSNPIRPTKISVHEENRSYVVAQLNIVNNQSEENNKNNNDENKMDPIINNDETKNSLPAKEKVLIRETSRVVLYNVCEGLYSFLYEDLFLKKAQLINTIGKFRNNISCHAVNKNSQSVELLVGYDSGDIGLLSPFDENLIKAHQNKDGCICRSKVTCISWLPKSITAYIVGFDNGNLLVMDINRSDQEYNIGTLEDNTLSVIHQQENPKLNPITRWHISKSAVLAVSFSPDGLYMGVSSQDGYLRIFHFANTQFVVGYRSRYGAFLTFAWSPDLKYLVTGGEDDYVYLWSFLDGKSNPFDNQQRKELARGKAHRSWISKVVFDPYAPTKSDPSNTEQQKKYRFASVGEDSNMVFWEFEDNEFTGNNTNPPKETSKSFVTVSPAGTLKPLVVQYAHHEPLSDVVFFPDSVVSACWGGIFKVWGRPGHHKEAVDAVMQLNNMTPQQEDEEDTKAHQHAVLNQRIDVNTMLNTPFIPKKQEVQSQADNNNQPTTAETAETAPNPPSSENANTEAAEDPQTNSSEVPNTTGPETTPENMETQT